jgi:Mor family transcriptional regulator
MKAAQQNLDMAPGNILDEISFTLLIQKESIKDLRKQIKNQDSALKEAPVLLAGIKDALFEMKQGELFEDEGTEIFEQLREIIGDEPASEVAKAFAGTMVYIPKNVISRNLHKRIKKEFWDGASYRDLSKKYGYTERYIRNLVDRKKENQNARG